MFSYKQFRKIEEAVYTCKKNYGSISMDVEVYIPKNFYAVCEFYFLENARKKTKYHIDDSVCAIINTRFHLQQEENYAKLKPGKHLDLYHELKVFALDKKHGVLYFPYFISQDALNKVVNQNFKRLLYFMIALGVLETDVQPDFNLIEEIVQLTEKSVAERTPLEHAILGIYFEKNNDLSTAFQHYYHAYQYSQSDDPAHAFADIAMSQLLQERFDDRYAASFLYIKIMMKQAEKFSNEINQAELSILKSILELAIRVKTDAVEADRELQQIVDKAIERAYFLLKRLNGDYASFVGLFKHFHRLGSVKAAIILAEISIDEQDFNQVNSNYESALSLLEASNEFRPDVLAEIVNYLNFKEPVAANNVLKDALINLHRVDALLQRWIDDERFKFCDEKKVKAVFTLIPRIIILAYKKFQAVSSNPDEDESFKLLYCLRYLLINDEINFNTHFTSIKSLINGPYSKSLQSKAFETLVAAIIGVTLKPVTTLRLWQELFELEEFKAQSFIGLKDTIVSNGLWTEHSAVIVGEILDNCPPGSELAGNVQEFLNEVIQTIGQKEKSLVMEDLISQASFEHPDWSFLVELKNDRKFHEFKSDLTHPVQTFSELVNELVKMDCEVASKHYRKMFPYTSRLRTANSDLTEDFQLAIRLYFPKSFIEVRSREIAQDSRYSKIDPVYLEHCINVLTPHAAPVADMERPPSYESLVNHSIFNRTSPFTALPLPPHRTLVC